MKKVSNADKMEWLQEWASRNGNHLDILNSDLANDFEAEFNPKVIVQPFGANKIPALGRLLSWGYKNGYLDRGRVSLSSMEAGFPKWVYVYNF